MSGAANQASGNRAPLRDALRYKKKNDISDLSIRELVNEFKTIVVRLVPTQDQLADCFTKSLALPMFKSNMQNLMRE